MLKIKNLHAQVEDKDILKGIDLEIKAGEIHAIMGPNGSGKSTLASVITGKEEYEMTEGNILFENEDLDEVSPEEEHIKEYLCLFNIQLKSQGLQLPTL